MSIFPALSEEFRLQRLVPPTGEAPVSMVLDTDTYNEVDDQFAVAQALLSPDRLQVEALYAAPFTNDRSSGPRDGMEKSYEEILRLMDRLDIPSQGRVFRGSTGYLTGPEAPRESAAARDLVRRAVEGDGPLYVVAIGAITNVASAILMEPRILEKIVVVWLGGQPLHWPSAREFNLGQDLHASRLIFDCGVPLVLIPCQGVSSHLQTTIPELERHVLGRGAIGDYLVEIVRSYGGDHYAWSKVIWDISAIGYLIEPGWVPTVLAHSPVLTDQFTWSADARRHFIRVAIDVHRDPIFRDVFQKLEAHAG